MDGGTEPVFHLDRLPIARPDHPGDLIPPAQSRLVEETAGHEERRRDAFGPEDWKRDLIVVAISVIKRDERVSTLPTRDHIREILRCDHVQMGLAEPNLVSE